MMPDNRCRHTPGMCFWYHFSRSSGGSAPDGACPVSFLIPTATNARFNFSFYFRVRRFIFLCIFVSNSTTMWENDYDLDVALSVISVLQATKIKEYMHENHPDKKRKLEQEIDMIRFEIDALYKEGGLQQSVMDKVFRLYAPAVKAYAKISGGNHI
jgi:hypothetical protein